MDWNIIYYMVGISMGVFLTKTWDSKIFNNITIKISNLIKLNPKKQ